MYCIITYIENLTRFLRPIKMLLYANGKLGFYKRKGNLGFYKGRKKD